MLPGRITLSPQQLDEFRRKGALVIRGFYDRESQIVPVQQAIYDIIGLIAERHEMVLERPDFTPDQFDAGYRQLIAIDRSYGGEVYDAIKQIPAFLRLISCDRNEDL